MSLALPARLPEFGDWHESRSQEKMATFSAEFEELRINHRRHREAKGAETELLEVLEEFQHLKCEAEPSDSNHVSTTSGSTLRHSALSSEGSQMSTDARKNSEELPTVAVASFLQAARKLQTRDKLPALLRRRRKRAVIDHPPAGHLEDHWRQNPFIQESHPPAENDDLSWRPWELGSFGRRQSLDDQSIKAIGLADGEEEEGEKGGLGEDAFSEDGTEASGIWMDIEASVLEDESHIMFMEAAKKAHVRGRMGKLRRHKSINASNFKEWAGQLLVV